MRQSTVAQRWPNSARVAWLADKARREAEKEADRLARRPRVPKVPPSRSQELRGEISKLLEPLVQLEKVDVLEGIRDYLTHLRILHDAPEPEDPLPAETGYPVDIPF